MAIHQPTASARAGEHYRLASHQVGPVTAAIRAVRAPSYEADSAIQAICEGMERFFAEQRATLGLARGSALAKRATALRERLAARKRPAPSDPHVPLRTGLIEAHAAAMAVRPIFDEEDPDAPAYKAALAVDNRLWRTIGEVLALPAPRTVEGLSVVGLAAAFQIEGALAHGCLENEDKLAAAAKAILAVTGTALPPAFTGFGDEAPAAA